MFNMTNLLIIFISIALINSTLGLDASPPELDFQPKPSEKESTLIWYNPNDPSKFEPLINTLDEFLKPYDSSVINDPDKNYYYCEQGIPPTPDSNKTCVVNINHFNPCLNKFSYTFNSSTGDGPCVFLTLKQTNRTIGWLPEFYDTSTIPSETSDYIKKTIADIENNEGPGSNQLKVVWLTCDGSSPVDAENIGPIQFIPKFGFDGKYFPYVNSENYLTPLVALYFENPTRGVVINIECKLWARNIHRNAEENQGFITFQLLIDN